VKEMAQEHGVYLLRGEKMNLVAKPHPLSFLKYHIFALYLIGVAVFLRWFYSYLNSSEPLLEALSSFGIILGSIGMQTADVILLITFWIILLLSGFVVGALWVSKMPLVCTALVAAVGTALELFFPAPYDVMLIQKPMVKLLLLGVASVMGIILTEIYRRGHAYVVTNYRVIMRKGFIRKEERELMYDKITDIYLNQGILGRLFNFGTVIPVTASGFGLGEDSAQAFTATAVSSEKGMMAGGFGGRRSAQGPRVATHFSLFGIPDPRKVRIILGNRQLETHVDSYRNFNTNRS
jgi:membrane protein YdbS with pleckstrin-like domain